MSSNELFGGPKRILSVVAVIVVVAVLAALATLLVRHLLGPPEGQSPYESTSSSVTYTTPMSIQVASSWENAELATVEMSVIWF